MRIALSPEAMADLDRLRGFLSNKDQRAAARASAKLLAAIESLKQFPDRGRISPLPGHRELVVPFGKSAYLIRYNFREDRKRALIVRVWHGREEV